MENVHSAVYRKPTALVRGSESSLALANRSWSAFSAASLPAMLPPAAATDDAPWREADALQVAASLERLGITNEEAAYG